MGRPSEDSGEEEDGGDLEDQGGESVRPVMPGPVTGEAGQEAKMSRSVSDTTLRKHALHLNLSSATSVLPSFTPLHQFKVEYNDNQGKVHVRCNMRIKCSNIIM